MSWSWLDELDERLERDGRPMPKRMVEMLDWASCAGWKVDYWPETWDCSLTLSLDLPSGGEFTRFIPGCRDEDDLAERVHEFRAEIDAGIWCGDEYEEADHGWLCGELAALDREFGRLAKKAA